MRSSDASMTWLQAVDLSLLPFTTFKPSFPLRILSLRLGQPSNTARTDTGRLV
jgi:hypothetical protein